MPYTRPYTGGFVDYPSTTTPINSTALNTMDVGIKTANDQFQTVTTAQRAALSPTVGQCVWDSDLRQLMVYMNASGGNAWQPIGNAIVCTSTTRPATPFEGQQIYETDTDRLLTYNGSAWVGAIANASVSSLPASPVDGQIINYEADATSGVIWQLRYRSASASSYKWEFIGGGCLYAQDTSGNRNTSSSAYQTTGSPSITLPLAGDYELVFGAAAVQSNVAGGNAMYLGLHIGGTLRQETFFQGVGTGNAGPMSYTAIRTGVTASSAIDVRYKSASSFSSSFLEMFVSARPRRVG